jgi:hypothetical protein
VHPAQLRLVVRHSFRQIQASDLSARVGFAKCMMFSAALVQTATALPFLQDYQTTWMARKSLLINYLQLTNDTWQLPCSELFGLVCRDGRR